MFHNLFCYSLQDMGTISKPLQTVLMFGILCNESGVFIYHSLINQNPRLWVLQTDGWSKSEGLMTSRKSMIESKRVASFYECAWKQAKWEQWSSLVHNRWESEGGSLRVAGRSMARHVTSRVSGIANDDGGMHVTSNLSGDFCYSEPDYIQLKWPFYKNYLLDWCGSSLFRFHMLVISKIYLFW